MEHPRTAVPVDWGVILAETLVLPAVHLQATANPALVELAQRELEYGPMVVVRVVAAGLRARTAHLGAYPRMVPTAAPAM